MGTGRVGGWLAGVAWVALAVVQPAPAAAQEGGGEPGPTAPDGRPGLAGTGGARELGKLLRTPRGEEQRGLVRALHGLPTEVAISKELLRREWDRRGYFDLLDLDEPRELERLLARHAELAAAASDTLRAGGPRAEAFARMEADLGTRMAREVLAGVEVELDDLRGGLALLLATAEGHAWLDDAEAARIAARVDLAAAMLRAVAADAETLARGGARAGRGGGRMIGAADLLDAAAMADEGSRRRRLADLRGALEHAAANLLGDLATSRLRARLDEDLRRREGGRLRAQELLAEVRRLAPYTAEGLEASSAGLVGLEAHQRHGLARRSALEGLGYDPLAAELAYHVGRVTHFLDDEPQARAWFDRFLALRGIRAHQEATYRDRALTADERYALEVVHGFVQGR